MKKTIIVLVMFVLSIQFLIAENYSLFFDGTGSDDVIIPDDTTLGLVGDITIAAWSREQESANHYHTVLTKRISGGYWPYSFSIGNYVGYPDQYRRLNTARRNPPAIMEIYSSNDTVELNDWQFIVVTIKNDTINFYINGQNAGYGPLENVFTIPAINQACDLVFGDSPEGGPEAFHGNLDDISLWNIALTQEEIQNIMYTPLSGNETGLVGYWNFNEGTGITAYDATSNANDGTITGATWSTDVPPSTILDLNPIAYYPFNGNANDISGNGNDYNIVHSKWMLTYTISRPERFFENIYYPAPKTGQQFLDVVAQTVNPLLKAMAEDAIVTTMVDYSIEQAIERAGTKAGNKGGEAMVSLIEMMNLYTNLEA